MSTPTFSVIIPTYHRNDLLAKCLNCLAPSIQTLSASDYEVIVTDDGSQATAEAMVRTEYAWAQWVRGPHKGPAANRNNGARHAQGEFVVFVDDDCLPKPEWLAAYAAATKPDIHVYEGKTVCERGVRSPLQTAPINLSGGYLWSCNMMVRQSVFEQTGGFDERFPIAGGEDIEFRWRIQERGYAFPFVANAIVDHPPRPQKRGFRLGAQQESQVLLWYMEGHRKAMGIKLLLLIARFRCRELLGYPFKLDSFVWFASTCLELLYIASKIRYWDRKYSILNSEQSSP